MNNDNDVLKSMHRKNLVRESLGVDEHYKELMFDVVKKVKDSNMTLSEQDMGYTNQDVKTYILSQSATQVLKNKTKIFSALGLGGAMTLSHNELSSAIYGFMDLERYSHKIASVVNPNYLDKAMEYMSSADGVSAAMLGCMGLGVIGATMFTQKISERNILEESIAMSFENKELKQAIQEHKETEAFRLALSITNKYLSSFMDNSKNIVDLMVLSIHKYKKGIICNGLKAVFGENNFKEIRKNTEEDYFNILENIKNKIRQRKNKGTTNTFRKMFEDISLNTKGIKDGLKTNRELDLKVKNIYKKITKDTYEEFLVKGVRDTTMDSIQKVLAYTNEYNNVIDSPEISERIIKELKLLQSIKSLSSDVSNDKISKYSLISNVANDFILSYENNYKSIENKNYKEVYDDLLKDNYKKIASSKDGQEKSNDELIVLFNDTLDESPKRFIDVLKNRVKNFINDNNENEELKQKRAFNRSSSKISTTNFLQKKSIGEVEKKVIGIKR
jgi:hypothetical protein